MFPVHKLHQTATDF